MFTFLAFRSPFPSHTDDWNKISYKVCKWQGNKSIFHCNIKIAIEPRWYSRYGVKVLSWPDSDTTNQNHWIEVSITCAIGNFGERVELGKATGSQNMYSKFFAFLYLKVDKLVHAWSKFKYQTIIFAEEVSVFPVSACPFCNICPEFQNYFII